MVGANVVVPGSSNAGQTQALLRNFRVGAGRHVLDGQIHTSFITEFLTLDRKTIHSDRPDI